MEIKTGNAGWPIEDSIAELASLADTADVEVVAEVVQRLDRPSPTSYLGRGKLEELVALRGETGYDVAIFDDELSPRQQRNLEEALEVKVIDRTALILDIFARHAHTREGQLQVDLAQSEYLLPRLAGQWSHLERLGAGIGTRGPGEKKLEVDRRRIRERISFLKKGLAKIDKERWVQRKQRDTFFKIALVGYTNAGKSTLMNQLTNAGVKVASYLFSTLDPNTKIVSLHRNLKAFLTDTVGFIKNLPHQLVASFRATLSEIKEADLVLHVVDASIEDIIPKMTAVNETLKEISAQDKPMLIVFNKIDRIFEDEIIKRLRRTYPDSVFISSLTGTGIEELKNAIAEFIESHLVTKTFNIPSERQDLVGKLYQSGEVINRNDQDDKTKLKVRGYPAVLLRAKKEIDFELRRLKRRTS